MQLNIRAKRVETIEEGLNRFCLLDVRSIEDLEKRLIKTYGLDCYKKILVNILKLTIKRGLVDKLLLKKQYEKRTLNTDGVKSVIRPRKSRSFSFFSIVYS